MAAKTGIAWTNATWNPIRGCSRVSEGCRICYAQQLAARFNKPGQPYHGLATVKNGHAAWTGELAFIEKHLLDPLRWRKPRRIFVNSMSDLFHERVPYEWLDQIFAVMAASPTHTFQVLTKRPQWMRDYFAPVGGVSREDFIWVASRRLGLTAQRPSLPLPNVHLGVSVENQEAADERIPLLLQTPAAVRWISAEPLLGPLELEEHLYAADVAGGAPDDMPPSSDGRLYPGLDWVVAGGESGKGFRPMDVAWLEQLVQQCQQAEVPVFVKQDSGARSGKQGRIPDALWELKQFPKEPARG